MASTAPTEKISPERQSMLDDAMAQIAAAFPKRDGREQIVAALIANPNFKYIEMGEDA